MSQFLGIEAVFEITQITDDHIWVLSRLYKYETPIGRAEMERKNFVQMRTQRHNTCHYQRHHPNWFLRNLSDVSISLNWCFWWQRHSLAAHHIVLSCHFTELLNTRLQLSFTHLNTCELDLITHILLMHVSLFWVLIHCMWVNLNILKLQSLR